jgi:hypothetical protein
MKIQITQSDIDGAGTDNFNCPIARAIKRTFNSSVGYAVLCHCSVNDTIYTLDKAGIEFIRRLCDGKKLVPTEIEII